MTRYSSELKEKIFVKGSEFLSHVKNMGKNIDKNISKNLNSKYSHAKSG